MPLPPLNHHSNNVSFNRRNTTSVKFLTSYSTNTLYDTLLARKGWKETKDETNWDVVWADRELSHEIFDKTTRFLHDRQKICHFRNSKELCRKDLLARNIKSFMKKRRASAVASQEERDIDNTMMNMDVVPVTFNVPNEYSLFVEEFKKYQGALWIMKPIGGARGNGIFIFSKLSAVSAWKSFCSPIKTKEKSSEKDRHPAAYIVQKYIQNPLLIAQKKFDLRLYVLVTSFSPLTIWLYRSGFARFSGTPYCTDISEITNSAMHLTNVSIQKNSSQSDKRTGGKWELRKFKLHMISQYGSHRIDQLFTQIQHNIIIRSMQSVENVMYNDKHSFELYGYDVLIDENLHPWLLEVNASPSLTANTEEDYSLKRELLSDALDVVDVEGNLVGNEKHIGGFDLVYKNGRYIELESKHRGWTTYLGAASKQTNFAED